MIYMKQSFGENIELEKITTFRNSASWQNIGKGKFRKSLEVN